MKKAEEIAVNFARITLAAVFIMNIACALDFILRPGLYAGGFEVSGEVGRVIVQSFGILFLMWNATYPPVIWQPHKHRTLFAVILVQQLIGVVGESWLYFSLGAGHQALRATGLRFMVFDGAGLILMGFAFVMLFKRNPNP
ncbi:MAG TPA: hypothetical protein VLM80_01385 [Anaerolineales bacterium]|nr:hypothetical protein [Anaerolineales bacterium]